MGSSLPCLTVSGCRTVVRLWYRASGSAPAPVFVSQREAATHENRFARRSGSFFGDDFALDRAAGDFRGRSALRARLWPRHCAEPGAFFARVQRRQAVRAGTCIRHPRGYLLWGTGIPDKFSRISSGVPSYGGRPNWTVPKGLAKQLDELHIDPSAVRYIGLANSHIDHIGNLSLFPAAAILIQRAEWEFSQRPPVEGMLDEARLKADLPVMKIEGDHDVFGDGCGDRRTPSVTPGNQSLLGSSRRPAPCF